MSVRMPNPMHRLAAFALSVLPALLLAGCSVEQYPQSAVHPRSDYARDIQKLLEQQIFWVVVIFLVVQVLLIVAVMRFRARPGQPDPKPVHGNTALEIAWTVAPTIILAFVAVPTVMTIYKTQGAPPPDALRVKAIGHQWWWEFQYPDLGVTTGSDMHVPVGKPVLVEIETADVIHSFWFPAMGGKRDAIPGRTNRMFFTADSTGEYPGQCAELCGAQHANMKMNLFVHPPESFDAWVADQKALPAEPDSTSLAGLGKRIYSEQACIGCHYIEGVSVGVLGPNLTKFAGRKTLAGGMYENTPENLARWLREPDKMKEGTLMLNLNLTSEQVDALVAYLQTLK